MQSNYILIIEDNELFLENLSEILGMEGFQILKAHNGQEGIELALQYLPALILCDIMMPELDGYGVLDQLSQNPYTAAIPFVFLTARATLEDIRYGMHLGANDYIIKPYTIEDVLRTVQAQLKRWKRVHQVYQQALRSLHEKVENLSKAANYDALTQLLNRHGLESILEFELPRLQSHDCPLALILCDIDRFKGINDTYGHAKGDEILKGVAQLLKNGVRESEFVCRWGGEEFLILAPNLNESLAFDLAERLRLIIDRHYCNTELPVTASFGVAALHSGEDQIDACLERADVALYAAKNGGRNQSRKASQCAPPDVSDPNLLTGAGSESV